MKVLTYYYDIVVLLSRKYTLSLLRLHGVYIYIYIWKGSYAVLISHVVQVRQGGISPYWAPWNKYLFTIPSIFISLLPTNTMLNELTYIPRILYSVINNGGRYMWIRWICFCGLLYKTGGVCPVKTSKPTSM